jgi:hypothetical protein
MVRLEMRDVLERARRREPCLKPQDCTTDSDCTDSAFPVCGSISVYDSTDYLHPTSVCQGVQYVSGCPNPHRG